MKKFLTYALVVLAFGGVAAALYRQSARKEPAATTGAPSTAVSEQAAAASLPQGEVVTVTYFTTNVRCASCLKIEELTRRSVDERFAAEQASGKVIFRVINTDEPANRHFVEEYQLVSKTVIVSESVDGNETRWVNVQEVWSLLRDETGFVDHVSQVVRGYL